MAVDVDDECAKFNFLRERKGGISNIYNSIVSKWKQSDLIVEFVYKNTDRNQLKRLKHGIT